MKINFVRSIEPLVKNFTKSIEVGEGCRYALHNAKEGVDIFTRSANSCTAILLNADKKNWLAHIDPQNFRMRDFQEKFREIVENFRKRNGETNAVVYGGWEMNRLDPYVKTPSFDVYNTAATVLDDLSVPLVQINGKKIGVKPYDNIFAQGDNIFLGSENFVQIDPKNMSTEEIAKHLENLYEYVDFDPRALI